MLPELLEGAVLDPMQRRAHAPWQVEDGLAELALELRSLRSGGYCVAVRAGAGEEQRRWTGGLHEG